MEIKKEEALSPVTSSQFKAVVAESDKRHPFYCLQYSCCTADNRQS